MRVWHSIRRSSIATPAPRSRSRGWMFSLLVSALLLGWSGSALAAIWRIDSIANSTVPQSGTLDYFVTVTNDGDSSANPPYTLTFNLPSGWTATGTSQSPFGFFGLFPVFARCAGTGTDVVTCDSDPSVVVSPHASITVDITASVPLDAPLGTATATATISGGGAADASTADPTIVSNDVPAFGIDAFDAHLTADAAGTPSTQAGAHPYAITTDIDFNSETSPDPNTGPNAPVEPVKDVFVDLPPGLVGNPTVAARCSVADLANSEAFNPRSLCAPASQVGVALIRRGGLPITYPFPQGKLFGPIPVFNMETPPGVPARFGMNVSGTVVTLDAALSSGPNYRLSVNVRNTPEAVALIGSSITFWGAPADPSHTPERACPGVAQPDEGGPTCDAGIAAKAFLRNPTSCDSNLPMAVRTDSWDHPGVFDPRSFVLHSAPFYPFPPELMGGAQKMTGCEIVPFDPTLTARTTAVARAGSPSGFAFDLSMPQTNDFGPLGQADLRTAVVTLPGQVGISPSSANGLQACSPAQIALTSTSAPTCPDASKVGTVTVDTPLLEDPLRGSVYLATPHDNPFDSLVAIYIVASGHGVMLKLPGKVDADLNTGQITTTFDNNPQLPFNNLHLEFKDGARAPLMTPPTCGTYQTHAVLTSWSDKTVTSDSTFGVTQASDGGPCKPLGFSPGFSAGTRNPIAGAKTSFLLSVTRGDGDQQLGSIAVHMPEGLLGRIASVDQCSDAAAKVDACPAGAQVGSVTVGSGPGSDPFYITNGRAYLTGPYKGAPYGLSIAVPAVAGPFDLGKVIVRSAIFVDKHDSSLRVVSDPLPTILQGIRLDVRDVRVDVNKPGFIINPTSCAEKAIDGTITPTAGAAAKVSDRFQVGECANLGFSPHMVLTVGGRGHTRRGQVTPLSTTITMPQRGQANLRYVRVTLPDTINARLNVIGDACTRAQFEADISKCAHAKAGVGTAVTPLLRHPLRGNAYFVKNGHGIPDLFIALRGEVSFDLIGRIVIVNSQLLRTTFATAPDVPIRSFSLRLLGGRSTASIGALGNLCSKANRRHKAQLDFIGQNGRERHVKQALRVRGCARGRGGSR